MNLAGAIAQWELSIQAGGLGSGRKKNRYSRDPHLWNRVKQDAKSVLIPSGYGGVEAGGPGSGPQGDVKKSKNKPDDNWAWNVGAGGPGSGRRPSVGTYQQRPKQTGVGTYQPKPKFGEGAKSRPAWGYGGDGDKPSGGRKFGEGAKSQKSWGYGGDEDASAMKAEGKCPCCGK